MHKAHKIVGIDVTVHISFSESLVNKIDSW